MAQNTQSVNAGQTYCVYLRGSACGGSFLDSYCFRYFVLRLFNALRPFQVDLHAYAVFSDDVYLLLTPRSSKGLGSLIESVSTSYNQYFQQRYERNSVPIANTVKLSRVVGSQLILDCQKYIERKVLDDGLRQHAGAYEWSSYTANSFGCKSDYITPHPAFTDYLKSKIAAYKTYRDYISEPFASNYISYIDINFKSGKPLNKRQLPLTRPMARKRQVSECKYHVYESIICD